MGGATGPGRPTKPITRGMQLSDLSAADLEIIRTTVEAVRAMRVGAGMQISFTNGIEITLDPSTLRPPVAEITVAVRELATLEDRTILVQRVGYRDLPPVASRPNCNDGLEPGCRYEWIGDPFTAYPDFGATPAEYSGLLWAGEGDPQLETPYIRARFEGVWILERPIVIARHVVVRAIPGDDANFVRVQDVKPTGIASGPGWDGTFEAAGRVWSCATHPNSVAGDFAGLAWPETKALTNETPILVAYTESGGWWVSQYIRWELPGLKSDLIFQDCKSQLAGR